MASHISMAKPEPEPTQNSIFLDMPLEIRVLIYDIVFRGSVIKLAKKEEGPLNDKTPPLPLDLSTTPTKNAILRTCRAVRNEAWPILAKHTTLLISNANSLRMVPLAFLSNVRDITVDFDAFLHLARKSLPSLEHVTLVARVDHSSSMENALHLLHCSDCGGPDWFLEDGLCNARDWKWVKRQITYLSALEGWKVDLMVSWDCYSPQDSYLEVLYDFKSWKVLHQKGSVRGIVFDAAEWDVARQQVTKIEEDLAKGIKEKAA